MVLKKVSPLDFLVEVERSINVEKNSIDAKLEKENISRKSLKFSLSATDVQLEKYLKNFTSKQLSSFLSEFKSFNYNQKNLFLNVLNYNSIYHSNKQDPNFFMHTLDKEIWRIKSGMLNTKMLFETHQKECKHTLSGFIRAFKTDSIFTTKVNIDGEVRRVFVKGEIGSLKEKGNVGYNHLIFDPKGMSIYNVSMISGLLPSKLTLNEISKLRLNSKERLLNLEFNYLQKQIKDYAIVKFSLKKEMQEYLKRYSIKIKEARSNHKNSMSSPKVKSSKFSIKKMFRK